LKHLLRRHGLHHTTKTAKNQRVQLHYTAKYVLCWWIPIFSYSVRQDNFSDI